MDALMIVFGVFSVIVAIFLYGVWAYFLGGKKAKPAHYPFSMPANDPFLKELLYPKKERMGDWNID